MHFFIEHDKISANTKPFMPVPTNASKQFMVTTRFTLNGIAKAYAAVNGEIVVIQNSTNPSLVNLILKPSKPSEINFTSVKYFVYRGLEKSSFMNTTTGDFLTSSTSSTNSELINLILTEYNALILKLGSGSVSPPTTAIFGYSNSLSTNTIIDELFFGITNLRSYPVKEGCWFGNFGASTEIGFEIILEEGGMLNTYSVSSGPGSEPFKISHVNGMEYIIDITGITNGFDSIAIQENILNYIDPAAFYGIHTKVGFSYLPNTVSMSDIIKNRATMLDRMIPLYAGLTETAIHRGGVEDALVAITHFIPRK